MCRVQSRTNRLQSISPAWAQSGVSVSRPWLHHRLLGSAPGLSSIGMAPHTTQGLQDTIGDGWRRAWSDGAASLRCGAQPHPAGGGGHVLCTGTFGVPGRVWHLGAHLDVFRVEHPRAGRARLGGMGPCCAGSLGERVPGQAGCPAALHVPSPAERSIAMTTLLKNSDRRLVWGFLLRAHLQTLLACQLLCWGFPGIPSCGRGAGLGTGQSSARGGVWGSLMLPVAPHALFSPQKYFPAAKRFSIPAFPTTAGT